MSFSRKRTWGGLMVAGMALALIQFFVSTIAQEATRRGTVLSLDGPVTPAAADYLEREIGNASLRGDALVIIEIDTPGGLVTSMRRIIQSIFASDTPVVTYVGPQGAQSASAGLYITYSAHVAAMAPATNTGSATPIEIGARDEPESSPFEDVLQGAEGEGAEDAPVDISNEASLRGKIIEDSVAYIRSLAEARGRNADWAEQAVRPPSASITANEALELGVIEIVATSRADLLEQLHGRVVETASGPVTINTDDVRLDEVEPSVIEAFLGFIADPNVASILFSIGTLGLIAEIWNPGSIYPGTVGVLSLAAAFYSFEILSADQFYLMLMGIGLILLAVEAFTPSFGLAGLAGLIVFGFGLYNLYPEQVRVSPLTITAIMAIMGSLLAALLFAVLRTTGQGPLIGQEAIRKREGRVDDWDEAAGEGHVVVDGERWKARSREPLTPGDRIKVQEVDGLVLVVRKASASTSARAVSRLMRRRQPRPDPTIES